MQEPLYKVPTINEARGYLYEAEKLNQGPWVQHSLYVAQAAKEIADRHGKLDGDIAYSLGCLHDIGRREGFSHMHHIISGYNYMKEQGYENVAKICLTHSFVIKNIRCYSGKWDCTEEEINFINNYLSSTDYDEYDRLIQLCDALALPTGFCLIEKRMVDVAIRNGINELIIDKWKSTLELLEHFEKQIGCSIYSILPNIVENTFGLK